MLVFAKNWTRLVNAGYWIILVTVATSLGGFSLANAKEPSQDIASPPSGSDITLASATAPANAAPSGPIMLAYKFESGQFVHYSGTNRVQYTTQLGDQYDLPREQRKFSNIQTNETGSHFRIVTVDEQGIATIEPVVDRARMTAKMHGKEPVEFDSASDATPQPQFQAIRDAIGHPVARFQVSPTGTLIKAIIVDATAPQSLRDAAERLDTRFPFLSLLPSMPVAVGDKWREDYSIVAVVNGLKQPIPIRRIYQLDAVADGIAIIKFKTLVLTPVNDPEFEKQIVQQTPTGTIEFDIERGLVRSHSSSVHRTVMNAFGAQSLLQVIGESTETLVTVGR
jgi:hypothetical protein